MSSELPAKPSLEQLKKQAKDLLAAHADRLPTCLPVLRQLHKFKDADDQAVFSAPLKLADVQFALAMDYGFTTWDDLVRHVEGRQSGLGERAARAWTRLRKSGALAGIVGGDATPVSDGSWEVFTIFEIEGPKGRFTVHETEPGEPTNRLLRQKGLAEFLISLGIQAPRITTLEVDGQTLGIYPNLGGESFSGETFRDKFSPADRELYVTQVAEMLDRMHAVPVAEACRILGVPVMSLEEAARQNRFGGYLDLPVIEGKLAKEMDVDRALYDAWRETREWITTFVSTPGDLVFGHHDMWLYNTRVTKTPEGYRLTGVSGLHNAGLGNLYDEFLRVGGLGLYDGVDGEPVGRPIIEAYNRMPGHTRRVEEDPLRHAIAAFWFYLAHENTGDSRLNLLGRAKRTLLRG
ncbi:MAG: phosphotransferase [Candidatus Coatesbacteria bacterium]